MCQDDVVLPTQEELNDPDYPLGELLLSLWYTKELCKQKHNKSIEWHDEVVKEYEAYVRAITKK